MRGVAAMAVAITHLCVTLNIGGVEVFWIPPFSQQSIAALTLTVIMWIANAGFAVSLFFVLSGYVLAKAYDGDFRSFAVRRLFRLLPPMWFSIAMYVAVVRYPALIDLHRLNFVEVFRSPPTTWDTLKNLVMMSNRANPVTWTMYVEMIGSACIPVLLYLFRGTGRWLSAALIILLGLLSLKAFPSQTVSYVVCFAAGVFVATHPLRLNSPVAIATAAAIWLLGVPLFPAGGYKVVIDTIGSSVLLLAILNGDRATAFLELSFFRFIGRCSYSLYLIHVPVGYATAFVLLRLLSIDLPDPFESILVCLCALGVSIFVADRLYKYVERPSILAGRRLVLRWQRQPARGHLSDANSSVPAGINLS